MERGAFRRVDTTTPLGMEALVALRLVDIRTLVAITGKQDNRGITPKALPAEQEDQRRMVGLGVLVETIFTRDYPVQPQAVEVAVVEAP